MADSARLYDVVERLSDDRKGIIFRLALDMLSAQQTEDFDDYSPEDIQAIEQARARVAKGDCLSFASAEEMAAHFGV
ncbi:MAG: hypothetical protein LBI19_10850 [Oscillospiraceae bacterium]|jgi:hypothetical protein|nr:hypothetical protein [Oscillospiraceae bacterium]